MDDKDEDGNTYLPSLKEIEDKSLAIRSTWSQYKEKQRQVIKKEPLSIREIKIRDIALD
jgi:hypothetical protein